MTDKQVASENLKKLADLMRSNGVSEDKIAETMKTMGALEDVGSRPGGTFEADAEKLADVMRISGSDEHQISGTVDDLRKVQGRPED